MRYKDTLTDLLKTLLRKYLQHMKLVQQAKTKYTYQMLQEAFSSNDNPDIYFALPGYHQRKVAVYENDRVLLDAASEGKVVSSYN